MNSKALPLIAGLVVAAVGPFIWIGCWKLLNNTWIPAVGMGAVIGLVMRLCGRSNDRQVQIAAVLLTVASAIPSYIWWDSFLWTPFMLGESIKRMVNDLGFVLMTAIGCYLAFAISRHSGPTPNAERSEASDPRKLQ